MASRSEGSSELNDDEATLDQLERAFLLQRRDEYAARLHPIADADLPPALRHAYSQVSPQSGSSSCRPPGRWLLHFGFQCPTPRGLSPMDRLFAGVRAVNDAIGRPRSVKIRTVILERPATTFMAAVYSNDARKNPVHTPERIARIGRELRKVFGDPVQGPMWFWDLAAHGPANYDWVSFDEAFPNGHPAANPEQQPVHNK